MDIDKLVHVASEAADAAGHVLMKYLGRATIEYKGEVDLVTNADREAEEVIIDTIRSYFDDHEIVAEESGTAAGGRPVRWIIDPIDGTTNYAHGLPIFAVSIGVEVSGSVAVGVVYNPATDEKYLAVRGQGATLNGETLKVSDTDNLDRSLLATGFPYTVREDLHNLDHFRQFLVKTQAIRRLGAASLDLAYVARGSFDGYWEMNLKPWDVAAGWLLVEEAGGKMTDFHGRPYSLDSHTVVASNGRIHQDITSVIAQGRSGL